MSFLQTLGLKLLVLALMCGATWAAADVHYSKIIAQLKATDAQAAKDAQAEAAATLTRYAQSAQEINDEAANQIAGMSGDIHDLSVRANDAHSALAICTAAVPVEPVSVANGPGTAASAPVDSTAAGSTKSSESRIAIEPGQLRSDLEVARKAIESELLFREWLRQNGQAPPETVSSK
jgi:hypothetical protein